MEKPGCSARDYISSLPADRFPNLVALAEHFGYADNDQSFDLLIGLFVDGLAQRVVEQPTKRKPAPRRKQ